MTVVPYKNLQKGKKEQVALMFDNISQRYDFLNRILTFGIDQSWRRTALAYLKQSQPKLILDVATGTGDFAIQAFEMLKPDKIIGIDISEGMLEVGRKKMKHHDLSSYIEMVSGDSEKIPFDDNNFDAITVSYGVRNFENLENGLAEMLRVLKPGGLVVILEASEPTNKFVKIFYNVYFKLILPKIGRLISGDGSAYSYLPESVSKFPQGNMFKNILDKLGYKNTKWVPLTFGASSVYIGSK